jgi:hypothetical protein
MTSRVEVTSSLHGRSDGDGGERALCGLAFDAHQSGDHPEPVAFASIRQAVTCEACKAHIAHVRESFTDNFRVRR